MKILIWIFASCFMLFAAEAKAQIYGCPDPLALNYNLSAIINDGSCTYNPVSVSPLQSFNLASNLNETSGLIKWGNYIWTQNDSDDVNIYALDTLNGTIQQSCSIPEVINTDWEEISQDADYVYLGDFGNNKNGNRTDLKILKISKTSILANAPTPETIHFSYADQTNFEPAGAKNTNFDCEALIVSDDSIYLFTKQWISEKTSVYALPKTPGTYSAKLKVTFDVQGLITGATFIESKKLVVLSGYSKVLQPFVYLLYDYAQHDFFSGNKRKANLTLPFYQVEGITTSDGLKYYISNEKITQPPVTVLQKLHILNLSDLLGTYLSKQFNAIENGKVENVVLFPNPAADFISIKTDKLIYPIRYTIVNQIGIAVLRGILPAQNEQINISDLPAGLYFLELGENYSRAFKLMKK